MPKTLIIINPKSGTRSSRGLEDGLRSEFGTAATIAYTQAPGHASDMARQAVADGYGKVVAVGGDGTVNEVAKMLVKTSVSMAIIPNGSGNGLARHLGIPMSRADAIKIANAGSACPCDCGRVREHYFFCTMGVGFDADVSHRFARCKRRGLLSYAKVAVSDFLHYEPEGYEVEIDGRPYQFKAFILAVCNASQYGNNAFIAPRASISDGLLDVTVVERGNLPHLATAGIRLFTHTLDHSPLIHSLRGHHIRIMRDAEGPAHIDGEAVTLPRVLDIECLPQSVNIVSPTRL